MVVYSSTLLLTNNEAQLRSAAACDRCRIAAVNLVRFIINKKTSYKPVPATMCGSVSSHSKRWPATVHARAGAAGYSTPLEHALGCDSQFLSQLSQVTAQCSSRATSRPHTPDCAPAWRDAASTRHAPAAASGGQRKRDRESGAHSSGQACLQRRLQLPPEGALHCARRDCGAARCHWQK